MSINSALNDFQKAHRQAAVKEIFSKITGRSTELLEYDEVVKKLHLVSQSDIGLQDIPLESIIGSVGRYHDFTRDFLPKRESDKHRWAKVKTVMESLSGVPPIEVYKIGEAYFVKDGNHRVSIARQYNFEFIQAYVTEVKTRVPLDPEVQPDDLIIMAEYVVFLEATNFEKLCPNADLMVTVPGQYERLAEHINVHRYYLGIDWKREVSPEEAIVNWHRKVYTPVADVIKAQGILRDFPDRTVTDLYLWFKDYQTELEDCLGWHVKPEEAASSMVSTLSKRINRVWERLQTRVFDLLTPDTIESGPPTGSWRMEHEESLQKDCLFNHILLPLIFQEDDNIALDQAIIMARKENSQINGLHVLRKRDDRNLRIAEKIQDRFRATCLQEEIRHTFAIERGSTARSIVNRGRWTDVIVIKVNHPPLPNPFRKLRSGLHTLIRRSGRPILVVTRRATPLNHLLLAYDGSPKSKEALYISAYLAGKWQARLTILSILGSNQVTEDTQAEAREYLNSHGIDATYITKEGKASDCILAISSEEKADLIIMGSYGFSPIVEIFLGSTLDKILLKSKRPILICR